MKIEMIKCDYDEDITLIGYIETGKFLEIGKFSDGKTFYRVDYGGKTISTLNRTKAQAIKDARKYIAKNFK